MKCSQCGTPASTQEDKFCIACGHPFVSTDSAEPPDAGPAAPRDSWVCPRCGHAGQAGDRFCLQCGACLAPGTPDLPGPAALPKDAPPAPAPLPQCPLCGATAHSREDRFCLQCGASLAPGTPDLSGPAPLPEDAPPAPAPAAGPLAPGTPGLSGPAPLPEDAPPAPAPAKPAKRAPRRAKGYHMLIAAAIALVLALAVAYGLLYFWNQPQPAIDRLVNGLAGRDLAVVRGSVLLQDVEESGVSWDAFLAAFQTTEAQNRLKAQLQLQAANPEVTGLSYPAVSMTSEPILPGIRRYRITVQGVSVSVPPQAAPAGTIALNGTAFTAAQEGASCTLKNLMPGLYSATFTDASGASSTVEVELFSDKALSLEETGLAVQQGYTLVLEGVGEGVSVMVNGALRPQTPQNGAVTLPDVPLGSEITLVGFYADTGGDLSFVFNDPAATRYSFGQGQAAEPPPSAPEDPLVAAQTASLQTLEANLQTFYRSYLECLNQESLSPLLMSTEANCAIVAERMGRPGNQANRFEFSSAALESGSLTPSVLDGLPCVTFNASFAYRYAPREGGEPAAGSNRQTVQMVLQDGEWRVNNFTMVSDGDYDNHVLASFD